MKDDLENLLEQIGFSSFLSLSRELSPFLLHEHVLNLLISKLLLVSLNSLYKFHVSCFVFSHFNSRPPLSLLLHFNCSLPADVLWGSFVTHSGGEVKSSCFIESPRMRDKRTPKDVCGEATLIVIYMVI